MRSILLTIAFLVAASAAAEREALTLVDGRTLVGVYDADAGTITLDGKGRAVVPVRADQVKARDPAPALPAATPAAPQLAATKPPADVRGELQRIKDRADAERRAVEVAWLRSIDLTPPPEMKLAEDPRDSERQAAVKRDRERVWFVRASEVLAHATAPEPTPASLYELDQMFTPPDNITSWEPRCFFDWYLDYKGIKPWPRQPRR